MLKFCAHDCNQIPRTAVVNYNFATKRMHLFLHSKSSAMMCVTLYLYRHYWWIWLKTRHLHQSACIIRCLGI